MACNDIIIDKNLINVYKTLPAMHFDKYFNLFLLFYEKHYAQLHLSMIYQAKW